MVKYYILVVCSRRVHTHFSSRTRNDSIDEKQHHNRRLVMPILLDRAKNRRSRVFFKQTNIFFGKNMWWLHSRLQIWRIEGFSFALTAMIPHFVHFFPCRGSHAAAAGCPVIAFWIETGIKLKIVRLMIIYFFLNIFLIFYFIVPCCCVFLMCQIKSQ